MKLTDIISEISYNSFKKSIKHRSNSEQLHKAIKEATVKLKEIDKILEHTSKLKSELCEDDESITYWKKTSSNIHSLKEMTQRIYNKINTLVK